MKKFYEDIYQKDLECDVERLKEEIWLKDISRTVYQTAKTKLEAEVAQLRNTFRIKKFQIKRLKQSPKSLTSKKSLESSISKHTARINPKHFIDLIRVEKLTYCLQLLSKAEKLEDVLRVSVEKLEMLFMAACKHV